MYPEIEVRTAICYPRIGLVGNPSDGYGGRVIAACFTDFRAQLACRRERAATSDGLRLVVAGCSFASLEDIRAQIAALDGIEALVAAAVLAVVDQDASLVAGLACLHFEVETDIPREVGLSGSSAIVVAALRTLVGASDALQLARLALRAERDLLGIAAGPQDRWIQALGGTAFLDFGPEPWRHEVLPSARLPRVLLVLARDGGQRSGVAHTSLRARFDAADPATRAAMLRFAELADEGRAALAFEDGMATTRRFAELFREAFTLRQTCYDLGAGDLEIAALAQAHGVGATLAGSGGALVAAALDGDEARLQAFARACAAEGHRSLVPTFVDAPQRAQVRT